MSRIGLFTVVCTCLVGSSAVAGNWFLPVDRTMSTEHFTGGPALISSATDAHANFSTMGYGAAFNYGYGNPGCRGCGGDLWGGNCGCDSVWDGYRGPKCHKKFLHHKKCCKPAGCQQCGAKKCCRVKHCKKSFHCCKQKLHHCRNKCHSFFAKLHKHCGSMIGCCADTCGSSAGDCGCNSTSSVLSESYPLEEASEPYEVDPAPVETAPEPQPQETSAPTERSANTFRQLIDRTRGVLPVGFSRQQ